MESLVCATPVKACDIHTAHSDDANRAAEPVPFNEGDVGRTVPACEEGRALTPQSPALCPKGDVSLDRFRPPAMASITERLQRFKKVRKAKTSLILTMLLYDQCYAPSDRLLAIYFKITSDFAIPLPLSAPNYDLAYALSCHTFCLVPQASAFQDSLT